MPNVAPPLPLKDVAQLFGAVFSAMLAAFGVWKVTRGAVTTLGRAIACHITHVGLAHKPDKADEVVLAAVERDVGRDTSRVKHALDKRYAPDIDHRVRLATDAHAAAEATEQKLELLAVEVRQGLNEQAKRQTETAERTAEGLASINATLQEIHRTQTTHSTNQAATTAKLELMEKRWTGPEQRAGPDPQIPRDRGGRRRTDPTKSTRANGTPTRLLPPDPA